MSMRMKRMFTYVTGGLAGNFLLNMIFSGGTAAPTDTEFDEKALDTHRVDSLNLLLYTLLLILTIVTIWMFKNRRLRFLHETGLAVIYGLVLGAVIRFSGNSQSVRGLVVVPKLTRQQMNYNLSLPPEVLWLQLTRRGKAASSLNKTYAYTFKGEVDDVISNEIEQKATFDPEIFFNILLPPIIFHAAYSMKRRFFFKNLGAIFTFAFIGTTITAFTTGGIMWSLIQIAPSLARKFSFLDTLYFGAVISATDPVTVLAIFSELHVDVNLYALVFGESVLNDAIAIVMTRAIQSYSEYNTVIEGGFEANAFFYAVGDFVWIFCASFLLGSCLGISTALLTKFTRIRDYPLLETCLFVLMSYTSFLIAEASDMTGIVSLLFCGMCQAHYTYNNLSPESRLWTKSLFELLNFLAENFIFSYIGVSMFTFPKHHFDWGFIVIAFIAVALGRAANVYPLSLLLNIGRKPKITFNFQHMLYFSGLRGAMAFALAIRNTLSEARQMFLTATAMIVIVSVIAIGGSVTTLLQLFGIPVGVDDEHEPLQGHRQSLTQEAGIISARQPAPKIEKAWLARVWGGFDTKYMKPLLTNSHPTLIETMPKCCGAFARLMTTTEQLTEMYSRSRQDSDADLCIAEPGESPAVTVQPYHQRVAYIRTASSEEELLNQSFKNLPTSWSSLD